MQFIEINGNNLYVEYEVFNENQPTLVFLHDSLGCVQLWRDFPKKMAQSLKYNILVYDRLGYGKSQPMQTFNRPINYLELEARVLHQLLVALNIDKAILFGHSDGGSIALLTASLFPKNIIAVIAEAAHIFVEPETLNGINEAIKSYNTTNLKEKLVKYHGDRVETIFNAWTQTWLRDDYKTWNIENLLPQIVCPLLFIQGELDEYGSIKQVDKTINQVTGYAEKCIIPNIGHTPHKEIPDFTLQQTISFIKKLNL